MPLFDSLKGRFTKELCCFCFEYFSLRDTPFRCTGTCSMQRDEVRVTRWKDSRPLGRVLASTGKYVRSVDCRECKQSTSMRLCPHCHMEMPHTTGDFRNYVFAVIGAKEAGKSHYLAILIDIIKNHVGPAFGMLLEPLNDATIERYRDNFYDPVFRHHKVIEGTKSGGTVGADVRMPLAYSLTFTGKGVFQQTQIKNVITIVFFDTAGEDLDDFDVMATVNKYIYRSDGIILLLDPLQLQWVRYQLGASTPLPTQNSEITDIVSRVTNLIERGRALGRDKAIPIPLALTLSKLDALSPIIDAQAQLNATPNHANGFDLADFNAVNAEMQSLLATWHGDFLVHQVKTRYQNHGFFGLSALGCNPHGTEVIPRVIPRRVADPFLWLLHYHGLIKATRQ